MSTPQGTYKVLEDSLLLIWDPQWANEFVKNYEYALKKIASPSTTDSKPPFATRYPLGHRVKTGQEITIEYGEKTLLMKEVGEHKSDVMAVNVSVSVGLKTHKGISIVYQNYDPTIVNGHFALRVVKKRVK